MTQTRRGDVRALVGAILLGSGAGALMGGAFLTAAPARHARTALAPAPIGAAQRPGAAIQVASTIAPPPPPPQALRARIRLTPSLSAPAQPFRFAAVAGAASDLNCLTDAVYFEARGEPKTGQQAVAQVVLNRVRHPAFPKTVCGVVHQRTASGCQFSFVCGGEDARRDAAAWTRAKSVASGALHGVVMAEVGDATHFETARSGPFSGLLKVAQIGAHVFYRFAGRAGASGMFHQHPAPSAAPEAPRLMMASLTVSPAQAETRSLAPAPTTVPALVKPALVALSFAGATPVKPTPTGPAPVGVAPTDPAPAKLTPASFTTLKPAPARAATAPARTAAAPTPASPAAVVVSGPAAAKPLQTSASSAAPSVVAMAS